MATNSFNQRNQAQGIWTLALAGLLCVPALQVSAQQVEKSSKVGSGIYEAVISNQDSYIYVTAAGSRNNPNGALYKIDPLTLAIVDSVSLKENPPFGIAINNKTQIAYTSNTRTNSVSAVDLKSGKLLATITHGGEKSHTREVLVDEESNTVYVTDVGNPSNIWVINGKTNTFSHLIENTGATTTGLTFVGNDRSKIYVTNMGDNTIAIIDVKSRKVEKSFPSGGESPINIASDGQRLFVANQKSGTVTVLTSGGELLKSIATGEGAIGITYDPVKNRIYSANRQTGTTTVIDATSYAVLADLPTGSHPNHVKVDAKGTAYVINKAKGGRPVEGQPPVIDNNGDTVTKIN